MRVREARPGEHAAVMGILDADVRPFYGKLGFAVEPVAGEQGRLHGER